MRIIYLDRLRKSLSLLAIIFSLAVVFVWQQAKESQLKVANYIDNFDNFLAITFETLNILKQSTKLILWIVFNIILKLVPWF